MAQPAYRDIADAIRADIAARRLVEGDRLPTVRELAKTFHVPTGTVARALDMLRAEGIIVSRHGRGLYVRVFSRITRSSPGRVSRQQWGAGRSIQDADTGSRLRTVHVVARAGRHVCQAGRRGPGARGVRGDPDLPHAHAG
jgi:GntR family transcriptional regulator